MDGDTDNTPAPVGSTQWQVLEDPILDTAVAAKTLAAAIDEALACRHPEPSAHHEGCIALLLDEISVSGIQHGVDRLLTCAGAASEIYRVTLERVRGATS